MGGMDAAAQNTFSSNDCDFDAYQTYNIHTATYYKLSSELTPSDCMGNGTGTNIISVTTTTDDPDCNSLTCSKFPMKLSVDDRIAPFGSIFPNPNNGTFTIQFEEPIKNAAISIIDLTGKVVYRKQINDEVDNLSLNPNISSGFYNIVVTTSNKSFIQKLVIE